MISRIAQAILAIPRALCRGVRYRLQRVIMHFVYPAQSGLWKRHQPHDKTYDDVANGTVRSPYLESITFDHNGQKLEGWIIHDPNHRKSKNWILQAVGNCTHVRQYLLFFGRIYTPTGFNVLLINNPGVGNSEGTCTPQTMGEAQAIGLKHIETKEGAENVVLAGHSMGGAAIGQAVLQHTFQQKAFNYLVVPQMTFGKLSHIARESVPRCFKSIVPSLIRWTHLEMDNVAASKRLAELNIPEHIINTKDGENYLHDGVIPGHTTLGAHLQQAKITHLKTTEYDIPSGERPLRLFSHNEEHAFTLTARIIKQWIESKRPPAPKPYIPSFAERVFAMG